MREFHNVINGHLAEQSCVLTSLNPATGEALGVFPHSSRAEILHAVAAAKAAFPLWSSRPDSERKALLMQVADAIQKNAEYLAELVTLEQGKPLGGVGPDQVPGSRFELWGCETWTRVTASLDLPVEIVFEDETRKDELYRVPYGVVAAISPWNWPLLITIWQIIPALRTGNTVVLKPSEFTSCSTLELVRIVSEILPPGVLNTVSGAGDVGATLTELPDIDKIVFTGSTLTGSRIAESAARSLTAVTLELGGNDAAIVLPDADPKAIAQDLFWGAFVNMGQTCCAIKRLYVPDNLHDALCAELKAIAEAMPLGNGIDDGVAMGPIQNRPQFDKVVEIMARTHEQGGTVLCGGRPHDGPGYFYPPTLVCGLRDGATLVDTEQFGPVLPIVRYANLDDVIVSANRLDTALGASVWSGDIDKAREVALQLQAGTVWINQHGAIHPMVPFGGHKKSGWGVEFGLEGLKCVTRSRVISLKK